jgi:hypothetical protein
MDFQIKTECKKCYFRVGAENQTGCERGRLQRWIELGKTTDKPIDGNDYVINAVCNTYCETEEHAKHIDDIIHPTCDVIVLSLIQSYQDQDTNELNAVEDIIPDIVYTCKHLAGQKKKPNTITVVCDHKEHVSYSELHKILKDILVDIPFTLIVFVDKQDIKKCIDEAARKTKSRYIYTTIAGSIPIRELLTVLNEVENIKLIPFLSISLIPFLKDYKDYNQYYCYQDVIIARCAYNVVDKNKDQFALEKLIKRAQEENMEHLILSWQTLQ